jgi:RNA polymerase subunit RPABC4/transcription elongation factor Spt4
VIELDIDTYICPTTNQKFDLSVEQCGRTIITDTEMSDMNPRIPFEYALASILKERGFPFFGYIELKPDYKHFVYSKFYDPIRCDTIFEWRRK